MCDLEAIEVGTGTLMGSGEWLSWFVLGGLVMFFVCLGFTIINKKQKMWKIENQSHSGAEGLSVFGFYIFLPRRQVVVNY